MWTAIDGAGVVVRKVIRERLHLSGGAAIDVAERDRVVEIHPVIAAVDVVETPGGPIAGSRAGGPVLTDEMGRATLERARG